LRPVQEQVDTGNVLVDEADGLEIRNRAREILPPHEQVNVLGVSHRFLVHACDPCSHRVAANHDVRDSRPF
jgi:hypothetical protein